MRPPNFGKFKDFLWNNFAGDKERLLLHAPVAGWALMGLANVAGFILNPEIKTKEKKFLIPQEIVDGSLNISLYYLITTGFKKIAKSLIDNDKISFANALKDVKKYGPAMGLVTVAGFVGTVIASNVLTPIVRNIFAADRQAKYLQSLKEPPGIKALSKKLSTENLTMGHYMKRTSTVGVYPKSGTMKI